MWIDNASDIDMLSYKPFAQLLYQTICDKRMNPLTIGLYGTWGAGKSTILKLTENFITENYNDSNKVVCTNINAWMFEGYDDAKTALMESLVISIEDSKSISQEIKSSIGEKIKSLFKRINYMKLASKAVKSAPTAVSLATGNSIPMLLNFTTDFFTNPEKLSENLGNVKNSFSELLKPEENETVVKTIRAFRNEFSELLDIAKIDNLVVMIDDLDRCTPDKIIDTLEVIKLFLSVPKTTFIIAVDERVIKYSIKKKYPVIDQDSVDISSDYIEKIIQLPITIPSLSEIDIINYMLLLVVELYIEKDKTIKVIETIANEKIFYSGEVLSVNKIMELLKKESINLENDQIDLLKVVNSSSRVVAGILKGNPRQAKRFLNTLLMRRKMAQIYYGEHNDMKQEVLAKLLCLEYINKDLFRKLNEWQLDNENNNKNNLKNILDAYEKNQELPQEYSLWKSEKIKKWVLSEPKNIHEEELKKYMYLCRESLEGNINNIDDLTKLEKNILEEILKAKSAHQQSSIDKLNSLEENAINKIINIIFEKYKTDMNLSTKIALIYNNFENWKFEIFEYVKTFGAQQLKIKNSVLLAEIYKDDKSKMIPLIDSWLTNKLINEDYKDKITGNRMDFK